MLSIFSPLELKIIIMHVENIIFILIIINFLKLQNLLLIYSFLFHTKFIIP